MEEKHLETPPCLMGPWPVLGVDAWCFFWLITGQTNVWLVVWNNNWSKKCDLTNQQREDVGLYGLYGLYCLLYGLYNIINIPQLMVYVPTNTWTQTRNDKYIP